MDQDEQQQRAEPASHASEGPLVQGAGNDDEDDQLLVNAGQVAAEIPPPVAAPRTPPPRGMSQTPPPAGSVTPPPFGGMPLLSLRNLFGQHFKVKEAAVEVDPELADVTALTEELFGPGFVVEEIKLDQIRADQLLLQRREREELGISELRKVFDVDGATLRGPMGTAEAGGPFDYMDAWLPPIHRKAPEEQTILLSMPTYFGNEQILHADPTPYTTKRGARIQQSTPRKIFTPQNTMRWTYDKKNDKFLSNTRLVKWSDGSQTLHVGMDTFVVHDSTDEALSVIATETFVRHPVLGTHKAMVGAMDIDRHIQLTKTDGTSIDAYLDAKMDRNRHIDVTEKLGLQLGGLPPFVGRDLHAGPVSVQEEYVEIERRKREKYMAARAKEGKPMGLTEQIIADEEITKMAESVSKEEVQRLMEQHRAAEEEERRQKVLGQHAAAHRAGRSKFDRRHNDDGEGEAVGEFAQESQEDLNLAGNASDKDDGSQFDLDAERETHGALQEGDEHERPAKRQRVEEDDDEAQFRAEAVSAMEKVLAAMSENGTPSDDFGALSSYNSMVKGGTDSRSEIQKQLRLLAGEIVSGPNNCDVSPLLALCPEEASSTPPQ